MTALQRDKKYWPGLKRGEAQRVKRERRRRERHNQNATMREDGTPRVPMPCIDSK
jgi:hypothetical protein